MTHLVFGTVARDLYCDLGTNSYFLFCGVSRIKVWWQVKSKASAHCGFVHGEASTSTSHPIITRLNLTPSSKTKQEAPSTPSSDSFDHPKQIEMANNDRTLKELVAPDLDQQPLWIQYPQLKVAFELSWVWSATS